MLTDFSLNNKRIKDYFEEVEGSEPPVSEFMFLHTHPLIQDNFLNDIEVLVNKSILVIQELNITGKPINDFVKHTSNLGQLVADVNDGSARKILEELRYVYKLCNGIIAMKG